MARYEQQNPQNIEILLGRTVELAECRSMALRLYHQPDGSIMKAIAISKLLPEVQSKDGKSRKKPRVSEKTVERWIREYKDTASKTGIPGLDEPMKLSDLSKEKFFPEDPETARLLLDLWVLVNDREFPFRIPDCTNQITIREAMWTIRLHRLRPSLELIDIFLLALVCADRKRWSDSYKAGRAKNGKASRDESIAQISIGNAKGNESTDPDPYDYEGLEDVLTLIAYQPWVSGNHHRKYIEALKEDRSSRFDYHPFYDLLLWRCKRTVFPVKYEPDFASCLPTPDYPDRYLDETLSICEFPTPFQLATWAKLDHIGMLLEIFEKLGQPISMGVWDSPPQNSSFQSLGNLKGLVTVPSHWEQLMRENLEQQDDLTNLKQELTSLLYALQAPQYA